MFSLGMKGVKPENASEVWICCHFTAAAIRLDWVEICNGDSSLLTVTAAPK